MRSTLTIGRLCLRQSPKLRPKFHCRIQVASKRFYGNGGKAHFRAPPRSKRLLLAGAISLSPAAFVQLSEKDNGGTELTAEGRMLEASRDEIKKGVAADVHGLRRLRDSVIYFADVFIWEPICTGLRFLHLVVIFVPVIVSVPALWIGRRDPKRDEERSGTLWWYWFLVKSMERAGPAFIKVRTHVYMILTALTLAAWAMGRFSIRYIPYPDVRDHVWSTLKCPCALSPRDQANHQTSF
jgi:aarF domain-containing kinase